MTVELPRDWMKDAACRGLNTRAFFVNSRRQPRLTGLAIGLCNVCPVQLACYCYALVRNEQGIWGGSTEEERERVRALATDELFSVWDQIVRDHAGQMVG